VFDVNSTLILEQETEGSAFILQGESWNSGFYTFRILQKGKLVGVGKLFVQK
jgi:hypothetical protein